jgi:hypothetical protein
MSNPTLVVNFTNILRAAFTSIFLRQEKAVYEKAGHKMLVKLTPSNITCAHRRRSRKSTNLFQNYILMINFN